MRCWKALSLLAGLTMVALSAEALAADEEDGKQPPLRRRTSEILMREQEPRGETTGSWLENITVRKGMGLVYRHRFETEDHHKLILNVGGPVLRKKHLGLMFEVRF
jgi:hypothetical protein